MGMGGLTSGGVGRSRVGWVEWPLVVCLWVCSVRLWAFVFGACCLLSVVCCLLSVGAGGLPSFAFQRTSRARAFRARFYSVYYVPLPLYQSSHDCPTSATCIRPDTRTAQYLLPRWLTIRAISTRFKMDAMCVDEFASQCGIGLTATSRAPPPFARPMLVGMLRVVSREQSRIRHHDPGLAGAAPDATPPLQAKPLSRELRAQERDYAASCDARRVPAAP